MANSSISSLGNIYTPRVSEAQFKSWMASIEERVRTLETQQRLFNASVKGGAIVAYDDNLHQITRMGKGAYSSGAGTITSNVLSVTNANSKFWFLIDNERGWITPNPPIPWSLETSFSIDNSGTSFSCWKTTLVVYSMVIVVPVVSFPLGGANGEIWLDLDGVHTTNHASITNPAGQTTTFKWDISSYGYEPGQHIVLRIYGKVTNATGSISVPTPDSAYFGIIENHSTADVNGDV